MRRSGYGTIGNRRSGSAVWQWVVIGVILGFACSAVIALAGIAAGVLNLDTGDSGSGTEIIQIVTATPGQPSPTVVVPTEVLVSPTTEQSVATGIATSTPTDQPTNLVQVAPSATPIPEDTPTPTLEPPTPTAGAVDTAGAIPDILRTIQTELVDVDGGQFQMGTTPQEVFNAVRECVDIFGGRCVAADGEDSSPAHMVTINPFRMERFEVTYFQYITFLNWMGPRSHLNGCAQQACLATINESETSNVIFDNANYRVNDQISNHPVANVTWFGAKAYCESLGRRLPTEAEWERAARGSDGRIYPWGEIFDVSFAKTNRPADAPIGALPVGSFTQAASPYGVLDMAGNIAEWVSDWYSPNFYSQPEAGQLNPTGPPVGTDKVIRGGSWDTPPFFVRTVHRQNRVPNDPAPWAGFRCAADAETTPSVDVGTGTGNTAGQDTSGVPIFDPNATPDPATLGTVGGDEETTANSQPTIPPGG